MLNTKKMSTFNARFQKLIDELFLHQYSNSYKRIYKIVTVISIVVVLGITYRYSLIRKIGYDEIPNLNDLDEINYAWQGISLRQTGIPIAWSTFVNIKRDHDIPIQGKIDGFSINENGNLVNLSNFQQFSKPVYAVSEIDYGIGKRQLEFMAPFFDHPPLGGLILSLGINKDAKTFKDINLGQTRSVALVIAIITSILIFILGSLITDNPLIGVLGTLIYSTVPTYMLASRLAFLENIAVPFVLTSLILLVIYKKFSFRKEYISFLLLTMSGLIAGLATLVKESSIGFLLGLILVLLLYKVSKKDLLIFLLSASIPIAGYILWGLSLSPRVFTQVFLDNSTRGFYGPLNLLTMIPNLRFANFPLDGWWIWGFLSLLIVSIWNKSKFRFITIPVIVHLLVVLLLGGVNYPWYFLMLIPFFAIFSGIVIFDLFINPTLPVGLTFLLIPLSSSLYWGHDVLRGSSNLLEYRILLLSFLTILTIRLLKDKQRAVSLFWIIFFTILLILNFKWSSQSILYILAHWNNLPIPSLPSV